MVHWDLEKQECRDLQDPGIREKSIRAYLSWTEHAMTSIA